MSHPETLPDNAMRELRLVVVQDELQPCPYRDNVVARMPLRMPVGPVTDRMTDQLLAAGFRRSGGFLYRTECPQCRECKPTRIEVDQFQMTRSMRRVLVRGDRELQVQWGRPLVDDRRVWLFNQHRQIRDLGTDGETVTAEAYRSFLTETCCDTRELSIRFDGSLIAIAIVDVGESAISAVYTHFDPAASRFSLGTYAILKQIQWAKDSGRRYAYLGMYVADNDHLNYKSRFVPQQRLDDNLWDTVPPLSSG
ncbi:arginyl-tRNA-protein transferase [Rubripirellula lacrimiformis]|uniref:Aspartate/glutamate leucyltransferase n=1 Tax=Rubripirellula lacrimiformis TaxID=1930273 RepID=A0A517NHK5_9BACT|nr:arginyltransferase [Rubripirellula lacrimiformis]QDT06619.1 arginyl-tRNA-protein transferase [Rubripirellula lacrimiformis]